MFTPDQRNFILAAAHTPFEGQIPDDRDSAAFLGFLSNWVQAQDTKFSAASVAGAAGSFSATVTVSIENAAGALDAFNQSSQITVNASGSHTPLLNGAAGPLVLTMVDGQASFTLSATAAGSVTLAWSGTSLTAPSLTSVSLA
jgi:hypothetical protein